MATVLETGVGARFFHPMSNCKVATYKPCRLSRCATGRDNDSSKRRLSPWGVLHARYIDTAA
jgi:hypothetical protein